MSPSVLIGIYISLLILPFASIIHCSERDPLASTIIRVQVTIAVTLLTNISVVIHGFWGDNQHLSAMDWIFRLILASVVTNMVTLSMIAYRRLRDRFQPKD